MTTPESGAAATQQKCETCYEHAAKCFADPVASAVSPQPNKTEIEKYFDVVIKVEEGDPAPNLQPGDLVLWPGHAGIATGNGDTISQCGVSIDHWKKRRAIENLTATEKGNFARFLIRKHLFERMPAAQRNQEIAKLIASGLDWDAKPLSGSDKKTYETIRDKLGLTDAEALDFHEVEASPCSHSDVNAGDLSPLMCGKLWREKNAGEKCYYTVYRLKDKYRKHKVCKHSQTLLFDLKYEDIKKVAYPGGARYTDYELRYSLKQTVPESKDLGTWAGPFRLEGGHTHYGWTGWVTFDLPLDVFESLSEAALRSIAERAITRQGH